MHPETKQTLHSAKSKKPSKKKTRSASKSPSKSKKTTKSSKGKLKKSRSRSSSPAKKLPVDLLSKPVMENAYYISHNAPQFLMYRGFSWDSGNTSKKKGKKKGKKKWKRRFIEQEQTGITLTIVRNILCIMGVKRLLIKQVISDMCYWGVPVFSTLYIRGYAITRQCSCCYCFPSGLSCLSLTSVTWIPKATFDYFMTI